MSDASTKHARFFPWAYAPLGLKLSVTQARYDFDRDALVHADRHLVEADEPFEQLDLQLQIEVPADVRSKVIPAGDDASLSVLVSVRCDDTRLRRGELLPVASQDSLLHRLSLQREVVAGGVELSASLVRSEQAARPMDGYASKRFGLLADARPWEVRVDRKRALGGDYLDIRYRSFKDDPVVAEADRHNLYRLELEADAPILWLNQDLAAAHATLDARAQSGKQAALREVAFDLLAPSVWTQLFFHAAPRVVELGDDAKEWERAVTDHVCRLLYGKLSWEVALERLVGDLAEPASLLSQLDSALQRHHELGRHLDKLAEHG